MWVTCEPIRRIDMYNKEVKKSEPQQKVSTVKSLQQQLFTDNRGSNVSHQFVSQPKSIVDNRAAAVQRKIDIGGDELKGYEGVGKVLEQNNQIPGSVYEINGVLADLRKDDKTTYDNLPDIAKKVKEIQNESYHGEVNTGVLALRLANPFREFTATAEAGTQVLDQSLVDIGIKAEKGKLKAWFESKDAELNKVIDAVFDKWDAKLKQQKGGSWTEADVYPRDTRKGMCGQTCNAVMRYLAQKYPVLFLNGKIQQQGGGEHQFLVFKNPTVDEVVVDPTYRQFDSEGKHKANSHIWVGPAGNHPFPKYTEEPKAAGIDLEVVS